MDRPNLMIKVPGTPEGLSAFEALTTLGINVNVTLLFSIAQTEAIFEAYIRGLAGERFCVRNSGVKAVVEGVDVPVRDGRVLRAEGGLEDAGRFGPHGRVLQPADYEPGAPPVFVMRYKAWRERFNGDPSVVIKDGRYSFLWVR